MYIGLWALEEPSCVAWICVLRFWFVILLRCGRLPFASQLGWLGPLRHRADIGQTQLHLSFLRHESRAAVLPPSSGAARQIVDSVTPKNGLSSPAVEKPDSRKHPSTQVRDGCHFNSNNYLTLQRSSMTRQAKHSNLHFV